MKTKLPAKTELEKARKRAKREKHEKSFELIWKTHIGVELQREVTFCERKWRFDFAHVETKVAVEIEGGVWISGRHNRGSGYIEDCTKYNRASELGWAVFRLTPEMITGSQLFAIGKVVKERMNLK